MIALPPPIVEVAPAPIAVAPPIGRAFRYVTIDSKPSAQGAVTVTLTQSLRFDRDRAGQLIATETLLASSVDAPPRVRARLEALEAPFLGASIAVTLAADGSPDEVIDADRTWAHVHASFAAFERSAGAPGMMAPDELATMRATIAAQMPQTPGERATRLREAVALLLPPPLPTLRPGESRAFTTAIAAPGGSIEAHGVVVLVASAPDRQRYRLSVTSDRAAGVAIATKLRAGVGDATPAAERARIELTADALATSAFREDAEIEVDPHSSLLLHLHSRSLADDGHGDPRLISERTIDIKP